MVCTWDTWIPGFISDGGLSDTVPSHHFSSTSSGDILPPHHSSTRNALLSFFCQDCHYTLFNLAERPVGQLAWKPFSDALLGSNSSITNWLPGKILVPRYTVGSIRTGASIFRPRRAGIPQQVY